ncbi:MAG: phosphotransferase-like protein [Terriglobales bacterium]
MIAAAPTPAPGDVVLLTGPVAAGKTTVARELQKILPPPVAHIEGDAFWPFIPPPVAAHREEMFPVLMRAMTAAAIPFARSGCRVLLDFSIPPAFYPTARKILKEIPLQAVVLLPRLAVCETRARGRVECPLDDYGMYREFYALFQEGSASALCDDAASATALALRIRDGLAEGRYRLP